MDATNGPLIDPLPLFETFEIMVGISVLAAIAGFTIFSDEIPSLTASMMRLLQSQTRNKMKEAEGLLKLIVPESEHIIGDLLEEY